ncbi:hypothetical protein NLG97_g1821 [Lecanicillium saksenae]|uniref:Uncharacterized protein n=1 Tax=Lecanicillium saksenae TaxID=468837 RepID=A0ACC1R5C3_9HYPO|nr:hypothetical protein NLG97_g1821 [Lecanicillium saksenae]
MAALQPIKLYAHKKGPNPWKVALLLEELDVPYETTYLEFPEAKVEPYLSLNPNGKLPAIQDPNQNIELFESGAIIEYLVEQYDKDNKFVHETLQEKSLARAWLHFQMSGQAPVIGYKVWMGRTYEASQIVSANEFLTAEIKRVLGVLDKQIAKGGPYLLGAKISYADLAFVPHYMMLPLFVPDYNPATEYPHFAAWLEKLTERPAVKKIAATKAALN